MAGLQVMVKRLRGEYREIVRDKPAGIRAEPVNENMTLWRAQIEGPPDSPYAGGLFTLGMEFPSTYPFRPPHVCFCTRVFHPNINQRNGGICLDLLQDRWSPALTVSSVLISIRSLLTDPNPNSPLESVPANLLLTRQKAAYDTECRRWIQMFASGPNAGGLTVPGCGVPLTPAQLQWHPIVEAVPQQAPAAIALAKSVKQPNNGAV